MIVGSEIQGEKPAVLWIRDVYPGSRFLLIPNPGSRIPDPGSRIPDLGSRISDPGSRIPDAKIATKERGEKNFCHTFLFSLKCHKIEHYFSFQELKKKLVPIFKELLNFLPKNLSLSSQKYGLGMRNPEKTCSGSVSRGQKGTGSRIRNTGWDPGSGKKTYSGSAAL